LCHRLRLGACGRSVALVARRQCRDTHRLLGQLLPYSPHRRRLSALGHRDHRPARRASQRPIGASDRSDMAPQPNPGGGAGPRPQPRWGSPAALVAKPADVRYIAVSHVHPDHVGNVDQFPEATVVIQKAEWDYALKLPVKPFNPEHNAQLIEGDKDLFDDGSLTILSTPGHTPGHQSLLVNLKKTGYVILSGDAVHFASNWEHRRVPAFNTDKAQSAVSMEKLARIIADKHAQLWINHDKPASDALRHSPEF